MTPLLIDVENLLIQFIVHSNMKQYGIFNNDNLDLMASQRIPNYNISIIPSCSCIHTPAGKPI